MKITISCDDDYLTLDNNHLNNLEYIDLVATEGTKFLEITVSITELKAAVDAFENYKNLMYQRDALLKQI